jgi:isopentenyldiphosphate isomerase
MSEKINEPMDVFDQHGHPLGIRMRSEVHAKPLQYWHRVVNIWIVDRDARILCTKRAETVGGNPGKWQTFVGGHVQAGMSPEETAALELSEEIGLQADSDKLHTIDRGVWEPSKHFVEAYAYFHNGTPENLHFNDGEIADAKWLTMEQYSYEKKTNGDVWCNGISTENQEKLKQFAASRHEPF